MSWVAADEPITRMTITYGIERLWVRIGAGESNANTSVAMELRGPHYSFIWRDEEGSTWVRGHDGAAEAQLLLVRSTR